MFSREGLNSLEEKSRNNYSTHGFSSLSAAQVGVSPLPGSSALTTADAGFFIFFNVN